MLVLVFNSISKQIQIQSFTGEQTVYVSLCPIKHNSADMPIFAFIEFIHDGEDERMLESEVGWTLEAIAGWLRIELQEINTGDESQEKSHWN
jgi:hypothetical protein